MRIYLDSCVYQDFKRTGGEDLLSLILDSKPDDIYCYSEAHLYDLVRDKSDQKLDDMLLIERVAEKNCYYYDKKIQFAYFSPTEYYSRFNWTFTVDVFDSDLGNPLGSVLRMIPINLKQYIKPDQIPPDCPSDFISLLEQPTNLYEFCINFLSFSEDLTEDQRKFKEFVIYLHNNALVGNIYESLGIKGFNGHKVTDKTRFKETYLDYHAKQSVDKHMNWVSANMYNGLEMLGIIKGRPRKQHMMNMINDGKHAYFGTLCDIVVSSDEDFVQKTQFLYDLFDIGTLVLSTNNFVGHLKNRVLKNSFKDCLEAIRHTDFTKAARADNEEGEYFISELSSKYYGYFNRLIFAPRERVDNFYFLQQSDNWSAGTLVKEIEYVSNRLAQELGPDCDNREIFDPQEIKSKEWCGRTWLMPPETFVELKHVDSISLRFGFLKTDERSDVEEQAPVASS